MAEYIVSDKALSDATIEHFDCHVPLRLRRFKQSLGLERIVRCRDCKHYFNDPDDIYYAYQIPVCMYFADCDGFNAACVKPDGFCAWGEPKEGE